METIEDVYVQPASLNSISFKWSFLLNSSLNLGHSLLKDIVAILNAPLKSSSKFIAKTAYFWVELDRADCKLLVLIVFPAKTKYEMSSQECKTPFSSLDEFQNITF